MSLQISPIEMATASALGTREPEQLQFQAVTSRSDNLTDVMNKLLNEFRNREGLEEKNISAAAAIEAPPGLTMTDPISRTPNAQLDDITKTEIDLLPKQSAAETFKIGDVYESDWLADMTGSCAVQTGAESRQQEGTDVSFSNLSEEARLDSNRAAPFLASIAPKSISTSFK